MRILLADDDRVSRRLLQVLLERWEHETVLASNGLEALKILESEEAPELILLDWEMPGLDGLEVCRRIREREDRDPPYIIFVTAKDTLVDMVTALDSGAADFIRKPFNREELRARIRVGLRTLQLQKELLEARRQMEELALYDPLTEVFNRRALQEVLAKEAARSRREGTGLSVAVLDLDEFKSINDRYGHDAGDRVLQAFTETARACIRESDTLGRWGGEEFLVVAPDSLPPEGPGLNPMFERLRKTVEAKAVVAADETVRITVSIGVAQAIPGEDLQSLVRRADAALYRAKENGRNQTQLAPAGNGLSGKSIDGEKASL